jgi:hypothetical protein
LLRCIKDIAAAQNVNNEKLGAHPQHYWLDTRDQRTTARVLTSLARYVLRSIISIIYKISEHHQHPMMTMKAGDEEIVLIN